jgi:hypothetical protein
MKIQFQSAKRVNLCLNSPFSVTGLERGSPTLADGWRLCNIAREEGKAYCRQTLGGQSTGSSIGRSAPSRHRRWVRIRASWAELSAGRPIHHPRGTHTRGHIHRTSFVPPLSAWAAFAMQVSDGGESMAVSAEAAGADGHAVLWQLDAGVVGSHHAEQMDPCRGELQLSRPARLVRCACKPCPPLGEP